MKSLYESENLINPHCPKCLDSRNFWDSTRLWMLTHKHEPVTASCHLSLHVCNRSLSRAGYRCDSRAYFISQHERCVPPAPIRMPEWPSRLSGQRRILFTQPRGTPEHKHRLLTPFSRLYFTYYIFPPHLSGFGHRATLIWGDWDMAGGYPLKKKPIPYKPNAPLWWL